MLADDFVPNNSTHVQSSKRNATARCLVAPDALKEFTLYVTLT
jgi:hypothetical protein